MGFVHWRHSNLGDASLHVSHSWAGFPASGSIDRGVHEGLLCAAGAGGYTKPEARDITPAPGFFGGRGDPMYVVYARKQA